MSSFWNLSLLLLLWMVLSLEATPQASSYYSHNFYSPAVPQGQYLQQHHVHHHDAAGFVPITYHRRDLQTQESRHKELAKRGYSHVVPYKTITSEEDDLSNERYNSNEYSAESAPSYASREQDSREYTIGTQIHVQHPITVPKKSTSSRPKAAKYTSVHPFKSSSYSEPNYSGEVILTEPPPTLKKHGKKYSQVYEADPFHVVPPPKPSSSGLAYSVYEPEDDEYESPRSNKIKEQLYEQYKSTASKKQVEKYLEDQEKYLDDALKVELISNPKLKKFFKSKEKEVELENFEPHPSFNPPPPYRPTYDEGPPPKPKRSRRRPPQSIELKRSPRVKPTSFIKPKRKLRTSALVINV